MGQFALGQGVPRFEDPRLPRGGIRHAPMPATPERLWRAISMAKDGR